MLDLIDMNKSELVAKLHHELDALLETLEGMQSDSFNRRTVTGKWSPAENARHLLLAVRPVNLAFSLPTATLLLFGRLHRERLGYESLVQKYQHQLASGAKASLPYVPSKKVRYTGETVEALRTAYHRLASLVATKSEDELDRYLLPHPILGKITLREMLYFTIYHIGHHHRAVGDRLREA